MTLREQVERSDAAPYVYSYPPTRRYRPLAGFSPADAEFPSRVNLYVHVPFCAQKCTFCGYLTTTARQPDLVDAYVDALATEIRAHAGLLAGKVIATVNFGGGTPSLLDARHLENILRAFDHACPAWRTTADELSIEATPESVASGWAGDLAGLGFNRVSIGVQSLLEREIRLGGRHNAPAASARAVETLRRAGIPNVCCDLMYGLEDQTPASWRQSVDGLLTLEPDTVELYATVTIPGTALARRAPTELAPEERVGCYAYASETLLAAGYARDSHLRFVLPGRGFYRQQANVFDGQGLLGFGAGARSYAENAHYRNVNADGNGIAAIRAYMELVNAGRHATHAGVVLDGNERMRRYAVYRLGRLDERAFEDRFGVAFDRAFPEPWCELWELDLVERHEGLVVLTPRGFVFRDVIAHAFFS